MLNPSSHHKTCAGCQVEFRPAFQPSRCGAEDGRIFEGRRHLVVCLGCAPLQHIVDNYGLYHVDIWIRPLLLSIIIHYYP